jgi:glutaredoxin 3
LKTIKRILEKHEEETMSIKLYSTSTCGYCRMVKNFLRERNVNFTEYNIENDESKMQEMVHRSGQTGVPVLDINGKIIVGFNREKIEQLLKTA